ncbi:MAG: hypothetical protein ACTSQJ_07860 [Promethearchaeota archaeon]
MSEAEINKLKKEKIILQAKLKQKEDKITELTKKIRELSIISKEASLPKSLDKKIKMLEDELKRSRKVNKDLRAENSNLLKQIEEMKRIKATHQPSSGISKIQKVSIPNSTPPSTGGANQEEIEYLKNQLLKKDEIISRMSEQIDMLKPENLSAIGSSYMKTRQLNAKIRELRSQLDLAKKSEAAMKERLIEMQRKMALRDEELNW